MKYNNYQDVNQKVSQCCRGNGPDRLAQCMVATSLQHVKDAGLRSTVKCSAVKWVMPITKQRITTNQLIKKIKLNLKHSK